jgi:hypothetical protein
MGLITCFRRGQSRRSAGVRARRFGEIGDTGAEGYKNPNKTATQAFSTSVRPRVANKNIVFVCVGPTLSGPKKRVRFGSDSVLFRDSPGDRLRTCLCSCRTVLGYSAAPLGGVGRLACCWSFRLAVSDSTLNSSWSFGWAKSTASVGRSAVAHLGISIWEPT